MEKQLSENQQLGKGTPINKFQSTFKYYPLILTALYVVYIIVRINTWTHFAFHDMLLFNSILFPVIICFMAGSFLCNEKNSRFFQRSILLFPLASALFALYITGDYYFNPPSNVLTILLVISSLFLFWKYKNPSKVKTRLGIIQTAAAGFPLGIQIVITVLLLFY